MKKRTSPRRAAAALIFQRLANITDWGETFDAMLDGYPPSEKDEIYRHYTDFIKRISKGPLRPHLRKLEADGFQTWRLTK